MYFVVLAAHIHVFHVFARVCEKRFIRKKTPAILSDGRRSDMSKIYYCGQSPSVVHHCLVIFIMMLCISSITSWRL